MSSFTVCLTHDVDRVYKTHQYLTRDIRLGEWRRLRSLVQGEMPYWQFEPLMQLEDTYGVRSTFFFLKESIPLRLWRPSQWKLSLGRYSYEDPRIRAIIRRLDKEGWDIGVHGSYNSYRDRRLLEKEKSELEAVLGRSVQGIRQHYLNLDVPDTWQLQRGAGFYYDASFGVRGGVGFPDGRYLPFVDHSSSMLVIPLVLMEAWLFRTAGNDQGRAWAITRALIDEAEENGAVLTVLWHSHVYNEEEFPGYGALYESLLHECRARGAEFRTCHEVYERYAGRKGGAGREEGG